MPLNLDDLVEEARLIFDPPRLGLYDAALTQDARACLTQPPPRGGEVAGAAAEVRPEPQIRNRFAPRTRRLRLEFARTPHRIRSATRTTRIISRTSCTRTMSAPRRMAAVTVAAVPSMRSVTGRSRSLPMQDLRDVPISTGWPRSRSSCSRR